MATNGIHLSADSTKNRERYLADLAKRGFDIFASMTFLIFAFPLLLLIAAAIRRDSPGPVLFRGLRMGRYGRPFKILKFRTMYEDPASYAGPPVTAQDDPRITELGRWLRDTKINELPQFWNVLKGEMSLVGPRPEDPTIAKTWPRAVWNEVLSVRPGITSPASIEYHNEETLLSFGDVIQKYLHELTPDKMRLDQLYVRYRSFWLDLDVLLWTALILLPKIRSHAPPETLIFVGPVTRFIKRYAHWFWIDTLVTFAAIAAAGVAWRLRGPLHVGFWQCVLYAVGFALLFSISGAVIGVNRITWSKATYQDVFDLLPAWLIASGAALLMRRFMPVLPAGLVLAACLIGLAGFIGVRYRSRLITGLLSRIIDAKMKTWKARERVLIVGSGRTAEHIALLLNHSAYARRFQVVGFVVDDLFVQGMRMYGARIIGMFSDIPGLVRKLDAGVIILADHHIGSHRAATIAGKCKGMMTRVVVIPDLFGSLGGLIASTEGVQPCAEDAAETANFRCQHCLARYSPIEVETPGSLEIEPVSDGASDGVSDGASGGGTDGGVEEGVEYAVLDG